MSAETARLIEERGGVRLIIPSQRTLGCGDVINSLRSPKLIQGVELEPMERFADDRGSFAELFRFGEPGLARDFSSSNGKVQVSFTTSYPGVIKAIHYHFEQIDLWAPLSGMLQVLLYDLRETSPTCGQLNTVFIGDLRPWKVRIPAGVGHGYRVIGPESAAMVYAMDRLYNPKDEGRIAFDDPAINYDWVTRPR